MATYHNEVVLGDDGHSIRQETTAISVTTTLHHPNPLHGGFRVTMPANLTTAENQTTSQVAAATVLLQDPCYALTARREGPRLLQW